MSSKDLRDPPAVQPGPHARDPVASLTRDLTRYVVRP
jgi:hypothetical protein